MSEQNAFLFLPDISGFTDFVSNTEVEHSQHIVAELLELLIDNEQKPTLKTALEDLKSFAESR